MKQTIWVLRAMDEIISTRPTSTDISSCSPVKDTIVTNDRWGIGVTCHHGDFYTCSDRYNPGHLVKHKWENAMTIDSGAWGYRRNVMLSSYLTACQLISELVSTVRYETNRSDELCVLATCTCHVSYMTC